jgi:hypothetical protein
LQKLRRLRDILASGFGYPDAVAAFALFAVMHSFLSIVAWLTSSGYEDSSVPYIAQAIMGLIQIGIVLWLLVLSWRKTKTTKT